MRCIKLGHVPLPWSPLLVSPVVLVTPIVVLDTVLALPVCTDVCTGVPEVDPGAVVDGVRGPAVVGCSGGVEGTIGTVE